MTRREAITGTLGGAAAILAMGSSAMGAGGLTANDLGWDPEHEKYSLPPLPYGGDALEPYIDAETMRIHHDLHHNGYVKGLNKALAMLNDLRWDKGDPSTLQHWLRQLAFHGGGHLNHTLFWKNMAPPNQGGGGRPESPLYDILGRDFGSFEKFVAYFKAAATSVEGSGWAWLVREQTTGTLMVFQQENQQKGLFAGCVPLLGVDVWEHAYYLKYQNKRADYVDAFMNVVNWPEVLKRYLAASRT
ncbi:MAG: superoxide dismutase [Phycisphaerales bacterium]